MKPSEIKKKRKAAGLTLEELAKRMGVQPMTLWRYEKGTRKPHHIFLRVLEEALEKEPK